MLKSIVVLLALLVPVSALHTDTDFAALAEQYKNTHGLAGKSQGDVDFTRLLDDQYVHAEIGVIDARYPKSDVTDKTRVKELQDLSLALIDLHLRWLDWAGAGNPAETALRKDLASFRKAVAGAHPPTWGAAGATTPNELPLVLGLKADSVELARKIGAEMRSGEAFGMHPARTEPIQMLFAPSRLQFAELGAFIGWLDDLNRASFWVEGMPAWADLYWNDRQVLPLVYPSPKASADDLSAGYSMNDREKTGLVEYVAQRGMHSILWFFYGDRLDLAFESGLALEVVITLYGENNTRTGSATRGNTTQAREMFVPGGASQGGTLPKLNADSAWRSLLGADHFVKALRESQKAGARDGSRGGSKIAFFDIVSDDTSKHAWVRAPFLGSGTKGKELPPAEFLQDYGEFYRAYKACFAFWLSTDAAPKGGKKASEKLFSQLLGALVSSPEGATFEATIQSVYGVPYSASEEGTDSLEWRFLAWLGQQK
ncbi:MAG: hypothetical protein K8S98_11555 [Planctomycetes bacterium]|nr:hypothetical protein [Planctomycetota bacterium]